MDWSESPTTTSSPGGTLLTGRADQLGDQAELGVVGVLVLVDQDLAEPAPVVLGDVREAGHEGHRVTDDVVEVDGLGAGQPLLVGGVDVGQDLLGLVGAWERAVSWSTSSFFRAEIRLSSPRGGVRLTSRSRSRATSVTRRTLSAWS